MTLVSVALGVIMVGIDGSVVAVANPYIGKDLHASLADLQWVTNAYLLVIAVTLILGGKLGDRFGRRRVFLIGVVGFSLTSVAIGLVGTIDGVIILRGVQGAFGALLLPNTLALLKAAFPPDELNRAVGIWVSASATATAAGPIIGGFFVEHISWQSVFFINLPIGAIALAVGAAVLNETKESVRQRFDVPGLVALALGLLAIVYGLVNAQNWGWGSRSTLGLVVIGLVLLVIFVAIERVVNHPLVPLSIFRVRAVSVSTIIVLLDFFALFGVLFFISLYLQSVHGFSPVGAGLRLLPLTIAFAVAGPLGARLVNQIRPLAPHHLRPPRLVHRHLLLRHAPGGLLLRPPVAPVRVAWPRDRPGRHVRHGRHRRRCPRRRSRRRRRHPDDIHPIGRGSRNGRLRLHPCRLGHQRAECGSHHSWRAALR